MSWEDEFRHRMEKFEASSSAGKNGDPVSIKIRVASGCFHREHSPNAYRIIDEYLYSHRSTEFAFEEHESGPELLIYLSLAAAGISLSASVINLVTAIIKARTDGIKHGDHLHEPLELIVRGFDKDSNLKEEKILRIDSWHDVSEEIIEKALQTSANKMIPKNKSKKRPSA